MAAWERYDEARQLLNLSIELVPDHIVSYTQLADLFLLTGKRTEAIAVYRHLLELFPKDEACYGALEKLQAGN